MTQHSGDEGYTLVEVLVAIVILNLAIVAIVGGLSTAIIGSSYHQQEADAATVLTSAVALVKAAPHVRCADTSSYLSIAQSARPSAWAASSVAINSVSYYDGSGFPAGATCQDDGSNAGTVGLVGNFSLQLITVTVTNPGGRATESVSFVKP